MTIDNAEQEFVSVSGGYLVQDKDNKDVTRNDMTVVPTFNLQKHSGKLCS